MSFIENNDISKKLVKTIKTFGKSILIISLPAIIILIILASFVWLIAKEDGTWEEEEKGNPDTYTSNATLSTTEGVTMDKTELVKQGLVDIGIDQEKIDGMSEEEMIEKLDMSNKLGRIITSIDECTQAEILWCINDIYSKYLDSPENLEYLLNAELVTQFPKIDNLSEEKVNGIIQFARINNISDIDNDGDIDIDDNPQMLTYTNIEDFDTKFENYINSGNTEVFNYFTIDDQENVIIATWSEEKGNFESNNTTEQNVQKIKGGYTEEMIKNEYDSRYTINENTADKISATYVTYNATKTKINYKSSIEKYTLSFKYLWALLIIGRSQDFVMDLAELAYNSQIIVGVYDSTTTIINTKISKYTENFRERYEEYEDGKLVSETNWTNPPDSYSYQDTNIITTITDSVQYDIMYANTWIVEVRAKYKNIKSEEFLPEEIITEEDEEWTDNGSYSHTYTRKEEIKDATGTTVIETKNIRVTEKYFKEKKTTGKSKSTTINNIYNKFEKVETEVKEKTDINSDTDMNFVKLLRDNNNAHNMLFESSNVEWLCQILEEYPDTANLIELTKYLINKAKNPDDTSLTFDFSVFGENDFNNVTSIQNLSTYLRQFSHTGEAAQSSDGKYYLMYGDGVGWPTIGNADIQWKSHYTKFAKSGKVLQNGVEVTVPNVADYVNGFLTRGATATYSNEEIYQMQIYIEKELVDEIGDELQSKYYNIVRNETSGLNLSKQQLYALTEIAYNFGSLQERNGYTFKQVYEAGAAQYEINSWEHNRFIWDNWWSYLGGMTKDGGLYALLEARDGAFETYVKRYL